jgi:hypothetical protein
VAVLLGRRAEARARLARRHETRRLVTRQRS